MGDATAITGANAAAAAIVPSRAPPPLGAVEEGLRADSGTGLVLELRRMSVMGRTCGVKGLTTAVPIEGLLAPLQLTDAEGAEPGEG
jgi:hypothetical protein